MAIPNTKAGTTTGTGAAINVEVGFLPDFVIVANVTDGDTIDFWFAGMAAGTSITVAAAAASRASNGISTYAGSASVFTSFSGG